MKLIIHYQGMKAHQKALFSAAQTSTPEKLKAYFGHCQTYKMFFCLLTGNRFHKKFITDN